MEQHLLTALAAEHCCCRRAFPRRDCFRLSLSFEVPPQSRSPSSATMLDLMREKQRCSDIALMFSACSAADPTLPFHRSLLVTSSFPFVSAAVLSHDAGADGRHHCCFAVAHSDGVHGHHEPPGRVSGEREGGRGGGIGWRGSYGECCT